MNFRVFPHDMLDVLKHGRFRNVFSHFRLSGFKGFIRNHEIGLLAAGIVIGVTSGCAVSAMSMISHAMHELAFGVDESGRLAAVSNDIRFRFLLAPIAGGIVLGVILFILVKTRKRAIVDPIEANALHGGHLSLTDSIIVVVQNLVSNGFGASIGLEAGYT
jgi:CIC family chloride channel protein